MKKYKLSTNVSGNIVSRGEKFEVILKTENVPKGKLIPFSIVTSGNDPKLLLQPLKGRFQVQDVDNCLCGSSSLSFNVSPDRPTQRKEIMVISLDGTSEKLEIILDFSKKMPKPVVVEDIKVEKKVEPAEPKVEKNVQPVAPKVEKKVEPAAPKVEEKVQPTKDKKD